MLHVHGIVELQLHKTNKVHGKTNKVLTEHQIYIYDIIFLSTDVVVKGHAILFNRFTETALLNFHLSERYQPLQIMDLNRNAFQVNGCILEQPVSSEVKTS